MTDQIDLATERFRRETCDKIIALLNRTQGNANDHVNTLVAALGAVLTSIECPGCCEEMSKQIQKALPEHLHKCVVERNDGESAHTHIHPVLQ
jgi:hypothetical protein